MHIIRISLLFTLFLSITTSCKKYVGEYNADFEGEWITDTLVSNSSGLEVQNYLKIDPSGSEYGFLCEINCNACGCMQLYTGKAVINSKHNRLRIGNAGNSTWIKIQEEPYLNSQGIWTMKLNDLLYYKQ